MAVPSQTIFVTGATGLVGSRLCARLLAAGHRVLAHSRTGEPRGALAGLSWTRGDLAAPGDWREALAEADAVVHLAGAPIAGRRWSAARKDELRSSRVASTRAIVTALADLSAPPGVLVCASASGFYGARRDEVLDENSAPGEDFLARLCVDWEAAAREAETAGVRVTSLRFGAVLSRHGGALARMLPLFRLGLGGSLGPADRFFPWIHEDDAVGLVEWALAAGPVGGGPVNAVAPEAIRMGDWARCLGEVLGRPARLAVPRFALRVLLGELADSLAPGQRIVPAAALEGDYVFRQPRLEAALRTLLG